MPMKETLEELSAPDVRQHQRESRTDEYEGVLLGFGEV